MKNKLNDNGKLKKELAGKVKQAKADSKKPFILHEKIGKEGLIIKK